MMGRDWRSQSAWLLCWPGSAFVLLPGRDAARECRPCRVGEYVARTSAQLFRRHGVGSAAVEAARGHSGVRTGEQRAGGLVRFPALLSDSVIRIGGALARCGVPDGHLRPVRRLLRTDWFSVLGYVASVAMLGAVFVFHCLAPIWALAGRLVLASSPADSTRHHCRRGDIL